MALLTLLINASTTGALVRYLGLARSSDIKESLLHGVIHRIDENISETIEHL